MSNAEGVERSRLKCSGIPIDSRMYVVPVFLVGIAMTHEPF